MAQSENQDVDLDAVVGKPARFTVARVPADDVPRARGRGSTELRQITVEETGLAAYELTLAPTLWLLAQRRSYRFQRMSEVEIAEKLLSEWHITPELVLSDTYDKREYRVQYAESDYAFVCRMLEDMGISFYFVTGDGETSLCLHDAPQEEEAHTPSASSASQEGRPRVRDRGDVGRLRPGKYTVRDATTAPRHVQARRGRRRKGGDRTSSSSATTTRPAPSSTRATGAGTRPSPTTAARSAPTTAAGAAIAEAEAGGEARPEEADRPRPGGRPSRRAWYAPARGPSATRTSPRTEAARGGGVDPRDAARRVDCACESAPRGRAFRPPWRRGSRGSRAWRARPSSAPPGEEIHTDEFGRVARAVPLGPLGSDGREQLVLDPREPAVGRRRLRGDEPAARRAGGARRLPRRRPGPADVSGAVYTNLQKVPYRLPGNKTQSGWKSNSSPTTAATTR